MSRRIKIGGVWRPIDIFMKVKGVWKPSITAYIKIDGVWKVVQHLHEYKYVSDGDDTHTGTCSVCGVTFTEGHDYLSVDGKHATCTEDGYDLFDCLVCGHQKYVVSEALGHEWEDVVISEPTCTSGGEIMTECSRCGATGETNYTDPTGHSFYNGVCIYCGETETTPF